MAADKECPDMEEQAREISRREFITKTGAVGAGVVLAGAAVAKAGQGKPGEKTAKVPMVTLGKTGRKVSKLGFGGSWDIEASVLHAGMEMGINYFDTAEGYTQGQSERLMGQFIQENCKRKDIYVVTKTHNHHDLENRLEGSLKRLKMDYVDTLYLHGIESPDILKDPEIKAAAERLKKAGKIKFIGFSCHAARETECLDAAGDAGFLDVMMFKYNFRMRDNDAMNRALDKCSKANLGMVAMKTLADGTNIPAKYDVFTKEGLSKSQAALKAIWADERIHAIVSEMVNLQHISQNTAAAMSKITKAEERVLNHYASLTNHLYCQGCEHHCKTAAGSTVAVADIMRFKMYHDLYGKKQRAKELYAELPTEAREMDGGDWQAAEAVCPHGLPVRRLLVEATRTLA
jgi:predicted aldo/keto reductase-like oxidoreductase